MHEEVTPCIRIGNAQAFWGDQAKAAEELLRQQPDLDYLTLDYLAEVSLSIMAIQRQKDPHAGFAKDFTEVIRSLLPFWQSGSKVKVITNAGGLSPLALAQGCRHLLNEAGLNRFKIGVVYGDDALKILQNNPSDPLYRHLDSGLPLQAMQSKLITANAYLGAEPLAEALKRGADIVITGRVADPSLTVAACLASFDWSLTDYDRIAQATVAGHLIECGTQVTGGVATDWLAHVQSTEQAARRSFPFIEMYSDSSFVITKPANAYGRVDKQTVKEQLLYEIGDPAAYISPDATVSFLDLQLKCVGQDRILVTGAKGQAPPCSYKVSATYQDGYRAEAMLAIFGAQAEKKAKLCGEIILKRVLDAGYALDRQSIECLGCGDVVGRVAGSNAEKAIECVLRVAVADRRYEALECFAKQIAPLVTSGPQGVTGYTSGRPHIRPIFSFWPCLILRSHVHPHIEMV